MHVLLVEDNPSLLELVRSHLKKIGHTVDRVQTLSDALMLASDGDHDMVLLDLGLPDGDGLSVLRELRRKGNLVPVIVLSARGTLDDRISSLDAGADDYMIKPFNLDELVARIRAIERRGTSRREQRLACGNLVFDERSHQAAVDGVHLNLRRREAALLIVLMRRAGELVHRDQLISSLYAFDEEIGSNALDVHVHHLRRRLAEAKASVTIETVRGLGYALRGHNA